MSEKTVALLEYPKSCSFDRIVSKAKIFSAARPSARMREKFTEQISQIRWSYKLYEKGLNLSGNVQVPEIQIFTISLKTQNIDFSILNHIDKAIGYPIIFELKFEDQINIVAAYKRPPENNSGKWVCSDYYESGWLDDSAYRMPLPLALNLESLYTNMIRSLMPHSARPNESLNQHAERIVEIKKHKKACDRLKSKINKEKQFNRRLAYNQELKAAQENLSKLIGE